MNIAVITNGIIENVIIAPDNSNPDDFGGVELPPGLWIGEPYNPPEPEPTEMEVLQAQVAELQAELLRIRTGG